jgi:3-methylfumaryl-CoA hydratase
MTLITDEIRSWIGRADEPVRLEVSRRDIIKYSVATEQVQEKYLRGDQAPPMFLFGADRPIARLDELGPDGLFSDSLMPDLPLKRVMAGGIKQRYHRTIVPGDVLMLTRRITDIYEKQGSSGPLIFVVYDLTVTTESGEPVMQQTQSRINR